MYNRRAEPRMLCADLVDVQWKDKNGRVRRSLANLEDISISGACLQVDQPVALQTPVQIRHPRGTLHGHICYCVYREIGYFLGVEFDPGVHWSIRQFRPLHLLDPRRLVNRAKNRAAKQTSTVDFLD